MTETRVRALSIAERDRRWTNIRAKMEIRGLNALLIRGVSTKWDGGIANIRYISQIGGNGEEAMAIFPSKGDPVVFVWAPSQLRWWPVAQDWVSDIRLGNPSWAQTSTDCLKEMGYEKGRIGVVGIDGKNGAGKVMGYDLFRDILKVMPDAQFEAASDVIENLRIIKSEEEIGFIAKASEILDLAFDALLEHAKPGVKCYELYAEIIHACLHAGGEMPMFLMYEADPQPLHALRFPSVETMKTGYMVVQEIAPKYGGYFSQGMIPVSIGEPEDPEYRRLGELAILAYEEAVKAIKPGMTTEELAKIMNQPIVEAGYTWTRPQWQGMGLENSELPSDGYYPTALLPGTPVELNEGMILGMQPMAATKDHVKGMSVGDALVITKDGVRQLNRTKMQFYIV